MSWQRACDLGFRGQLSEWSSCWVLLHVATKFAESARQTNTAVIAKIMGFVLPDAKAQFGACEFFCGAKAACNQYAPIT